jgi:hypothetical protein
MTIPAELMTLCDANRFMWRRKNPARVRDVFKDLGLNKDSQFCEFLQRYAMQFVSRRIDYEMVDIIEEDGALSTFVEYVHEELEIDRRYLPISTYEASSLFAVDSLNEGVVYVTWDEATDAWNYEVLHVDFYGYMTEVLS